MRQKMRTVAVFCATAILALATATAADTKAAKKKPAANKFTVVSPDIGQGNDVPMDQVFNAGGCTGKNHSPALIWSGVPEGTKSFAILAHDPDAPTGGAGFWHWVVFNIPAGTEGIPNDAGDPKKPGMPKGAMQGRNDFGAFGYGGPCPPPGKAHHYHFKVYALKVDKLPIAADATTAMIGFTINANMLAQTEIVATYGR
jgi:Raf kinase inhibitor-like YbhB/YbcL family protein